MVVGYTGYLDEVVQDLWAWADRHHQNELECGNRHRRPPVLLKRHAPKGILVPPDGAMACRIRAAIPERQRHRWFRSLKSSQALWQSVFGAISAFGRFDLLQNIPAECGRPAFFENFRDVALEFEREVDWLGEPRPTNVDIMVRGPRYRVAVECKFTEQEFGPCSRPRLDSSHRQHCDGSYRVQRDRHERCSLAEIGIEYWKYLPDLFDWAADRDHVPCPFGHVYQLARNALAATVAPDGALEAFEGHVLVVYDERNLQFMANGKADRQWRSASEACLVPGLLRRLSWQRLVAELPRAPELTYLVKGMEMKYGLIPRRSD